MDKFQNFGDHISWIRKQMRLSHVEFAKFLDIPKSTVQSAMSHGNTTLATAVRISERLNIPLDVLLSDEPLDEEFSTVKWFMSGIETFSALSAEQKERLSSHLKEILEILQE